MLDRISAPASGAIETIKLLEPQHIKFDNGCNLFYFNSGEQDLLRVEWVFSNLRFDAANPLLNNAVNSMITEGTVSRSASQIADEIDYYGAFLNAEYGFDHSQVTLYSLSKHLASTLPVIKDLLTNSNFPESELQTFVRNNQQKLQVALQKNDVLARRAFNKAIFGDSIYGAAPEAADFETLTREDMLVHYKQMYQPANCTIFAAGKIDDEALKQLSSIFGTDWEKGSGPANVTQPEPQQASQLEYNINKPEAIQSAIRMGFNAISRTHPDFPALQVLNTVLGGYFSSRLMDNLREDKGYTYGVGSGISSLKHGAAMFIATEVGTDVTQSAVEEIEKEINLLKTELISGDELALVRNYMLGSLLGSLENVFSHADKFKNVYYAGLDYSYYNRYTEVIKTVTADELLVLAKKYLDLNKMVKVVVGKI